jgi:hypothetical protein
MQALSAADRQALFDVVEALPAEQRERIRAWLSPRKPWGSPETRQRHQRVDAVIREVALSAPEIKGYSKLAGRTLELVDRCKRLARNPTYCGNTNAERAIVAALRADTVFPTQSAMEKRARRCFSEMSRSEISEGGISEN